VTDTLYNKLGGAATVTSIVRDFYERVCADTELQTYFVGVDMNGLIEHQIDFISAALGGPVERESFDLEEAHRGLGIDDRAYDMVVGHLAAAVGAFDPSPGDVKTILDLVESLREQVVEPRFDGSSDFLGSAFEETDDSDS